MNDIGYAFATVSVFRDDLALLILGAAALVFVALGFALALTLVAFLEAVALVALAAGFFFSVDMIALLCNKLAMPLGTFLDTARRGLFC